MLNPFPLISTNKNSVMSTILNEKKLWFEMFKTRKVY